MTPAGDAGGSGQEGSVSVRGLQKSFGSHPVLRGVELAVAAGSVAAVLGRSGSGKTTMLRIVAGFERPDAGSVAIGGVVVDEGALHVPVERRRMGYVSQEGNLFPHLDVAANVGFGLPRRARRSRVGELLTMVGLAELGGRYPHELSGGEQQRVALARALAPGPRVVLLDEPFASLDAGLRAQVRSDVLSVLRKAGTTAILVTHDQDEALSAADVVAVLRDGVIAQVDTPHDLYNHPADAEIASFVGDANLLPGTRRGSRVETGLGDLVLWHPGASAEAALTVLVRPEQLVVTPSAGATDVGAAASTGAPDVGARAAATGTVSSCEYHGHDTTVHVRPDTGGRGPRLPDELVARVAGNHPIAPRAEVRVEVRGPVEAWPAGEAQVPGKITSA